MGPIDDVKLQKMVLYVTGYDKWYQHFKDLCDGFVQPDILSRWVVDVGARNRKLKEMEAQMHVANLVNPVAQAIEIAKSEIEREHKKEGDKKRKKTTITSKALPKRLKRYA